MQQINETIIRGVGITSLKLICKQSGHMTNLMKFSSNKNSNKILIITHSTMEEESRINHLDTEVINNIMEERIKVVLHNSNSIITAIIIRIIIHITINTMEDITNKTTAREKEEVEL